MRRAVGRQLALVPSAYGRGLLPSRGHRAEAAPACPRAATALNSTQHEFGLCSFLPELRRFDGLRFTPLRLRTTPRRPSYAPPERAGDPRALPA